MQAGLALLLGLSVAAASPTVAVLPLAPEKGVTKREAARIDQALRDALERGEDFLQPLPKTRHDKKDAGRCRLDAKCLSDLAYSRGADLLAGGVVVSAEGGYVVRLVVVSPKSGDAPVREVDEALGKAKADQRLPLDRLVRRAFAPEALAGGILVVGAPDGATVLVDGQIAGTTPLDEPIAGLVEGEHEVTVRREGYAPLTRQVAVRFREVSDVEMVLTPDRERPRVGGVAPAAPEEEAFALPVGPLALGGAGVAAVVVGAAFGGAALFHQMEVERRAEKQQLVFPRDANLVRTGEVLSWVANGLYLTGVLAALGGGGWWLAERALAEEPERETYLRPPPAGAPEDDELGRTLR